MTEKPANTVCDIQNHWAAVSTLLGYISSIYYDLPRPFEIKPATTECWAEILSLKQLSKSHSSHAKLTNHGKCATT